MAVEDPGISVIICTRNRHETLRHALDSVLAQDESDFEILLVDDGSEVPVQLPARFLDRVRLIRTEPRGVGAARAKGLEAARGAWVAYCDDDDEWKRNHLSVLRRYVMEHPDVDLAYGDSEWVQEGAAPGVAYSTSYDRTMLSQWNYIFAGDVMHRTQAARAAGGFDRSLQAHEDWDLWLRMSRDCRIRHVPVTLGVHHWHEGCVSAGDHWQEWQRVHRGHQERLAREDPASQQDVCPSAARGAPFDPHTWQPDHKELIWLSTWHAKFGYGSAGRQLVLAVEGQNVQILMAPTRNQAPPGYERFFRPLDHWGRLGFYYDYHLRPSVLECERIINCSMWETTAVPPEHVKEINRVVTLQYVPCRQNLVSYQECGVRVPIMVLPQGIDPARFPYLSRYRRDVFTFGSFGDFSPRKGIDVLIRAFQDEFAPGEGVRLLLKSTAEAPPYPIQDPRIHLISGFMDAEALLRFLREMDVFVLPSRGEGFGLCALEAMATGLPLIATDWSGPAEYLAPQDSFPLSYRLVETQGVACYHGRYLGKWAEPDYEHLRALMRHLYEHPEEAAEKGRLAAERVHREWTWDRVATQLCRDLDTIARE